MAVVRRSLNAEMIIKKKVEEPPPPKKEKTESQCVHEGCYEPKAPGQTYVCAKHVRSN